jgi:uncharacterized protein (DUF433 family)
MTDQLISERIVASYDVMHGKPRVAGTRITVVQVLDLLAAGKTPQEIASADYYPELTDTDVRACLAYAR